MGGPFLVVGGLFLFVGGSCCCVFCSNFCLQISVWLYLAGCGLCFSNMEHMTVVQIKAELANRGLPLSGKKEELYDRLQQALVEERESQNLNLEGKNTGQESSKDGMNEQLLGSQRVQTELHDVGPNDSVSQVSHGKHSNASRRSKASSVSDSRMLAAAKKEALKAKMLKINRLEELEREELERKQIEMKKELERKQIDMKKELEYKLQKERLSLEIAMAEADAEEKVLTKLGSEVIEGENQNQKVSLGEEKFDIHSSKQDNMYVGKLNSLGAMGGSGGLDVGVDKDLIKTLIPCNLKGLMPSQELFKFSGNEDQYFLFINTFDSVIASKITSDRDKLQYLSQYTVGRPNDVVTACLHLEPEVGYKRAREILTKRYGNPERIATAYIEKILNWKVIGRDDIEGLDELSIALDNCRNAVSETPFGVAELNNPKTLRRVLQKLPFNLQEKFRRKADELMSEQGMQITFGELVKFLEKEARIARNPVFGRHLFKVNERPGGKQTVGNNSNNMGNTGETKHKVNLSAAKTKLECWHCKGEHILDNCDVIKRMTHGEKIWVLQNLNLCFGCLRRGHRSNLCRARKHCNICKSTYHPTLPHKNFENEQSVTTNRQGDNFVNGGRNGNDVEAPGVGVDYSGYRTQDIRGTNVNTASESVNRVLESSNPVNGLNQVRIFSSKGNGKSSGLSVVPVRVQSVGGAEVTTCAFLDNGTTATFCTKSLIDKLGVKSECSSTNLFVSTIHGQQNMSCPVVSGLKVLDFDRNETVFLPPVYAIDHIPVDEEDYICRSDLEKWPHLQDVSIPNCRADVELMIGTNVPQAHEPLSVAKATRDFEPWAARTRLGWVVCGASGLNGNISTTKVNRISLSRGLKLDQMLIKEYNRDFQDIASTKQELSGEDKLWLDKVEESCSVVDGKYQISLPLKQDIIKLPDSKPTALRRLRNLKGKLSKDNLYFDQYCKFMDEMLAKGYAEKLSQETSSDKLWYVPHFGARHPEKPDKVRVVFDCAARVEGVALNDVIMQGPDLLCSLIGVLLKFRVGIFAYSSDIETMFYQIRVPQGDRDLLRFLWWEGGDLTKQPSEYRMAVHLFGATSSPSIANFALKKTAMTSTNISQEAKDTILNCFYVDDCLRSEDTLKQLCDNALEVREVCRF